MFVTPETLMFLKRTFKNSPFGYLAPLAEGSITDMIKWTESPGDEAIMASTIQSFLLESWHMAKKDIISPSSGPNEPSPAPRAISLIGTKWLLLAAPTTQ